MPTWLLLVFTWMTWDIVRMHQKRWLQEDDYRHTWFKSEESWAEVEELHRDIDRQLGRQPRRISGWKSGI